MILNSFSGEGQCRVKVDIIGRVVTMPTMSPASSMVSMSIRVP